MNNLWINIRFGDKHLQLTNDWKCSWTSNEYYSVKNRDKDFRWFAIYDFPGLNRFLKR